MAHEDRDAAAPGTRYPVSGMVKWFDPVKGFGFVISDAGGPDILLHVNVLRRFGQSSVTDGARISLLVEQGQRGLQAVEVREIEVVGDATPSLPEELTDLDALMVDRAPLEPARVKWFDKAKGFGFANIFGSTEDIFLHIEVLRQSGLSDVQPGEALALKVLEGNRGKLAARVQAWESVNSVSV